MTNPILEDNLRALLHRCTACLTDLDLDRALARFERRARPGLRHGRVLVAVAAALLLTLLGWLVSSPAPQIQPPETESGAAQEPEKRESPEDIARLIGELGSPAPEVQEKARKRLIALGASALAPLDRALYHEDPEVRIQSQALAKLVRRSVDIQSALSFVRASVKIVREHWKARDFTDFEQTVFEAFDPGGLKYVHYVPRRSIDTSFDSLRITDTLPVSSWRGVNDTLTQAIIDALDKENGIIFLGFPEAITDLSRVCVFTLPDTVGWSAYVVVNIPEIADLGSTLVHVVVPEGEPAQLREGLQAAPHPGGGMTITSLAAGGSNFGKAFKKGDVVRALNGVPVSTLRDLHSLFEASSTGTRVALEREGKSFSILFHVLPVVRPKSPDNVKREAEAESLFDRAEKALSEDPKQALELYTQLLTQYSNTDLISKAKKIYIEERVASLKSKKRENQ